MVRMGRIGQRPKDIKNSLAPDALADRRHMFHGRMMTLGKKKNKADLLKAGRKLLMGHFNIDP